MYRVFLTDCDKDYTSQLWHWGDHDWLVHSSTGLCLTSTTNDKAVLLHCSKKNWRQRWLCDGQAIEQPYSGKRLTVIASRSAIKSTPSQLPSDNEKFSEKKLRKLLEEESRGGLKLTLEKAYRSQQQLWNTYDGTYVDICSQSMQAHRVSECYYQSAEGTIEGWVRCDMDGYLVAGIEYNSIQLTTISRLLCCASVNTYKPQKQRTDPFLCEHRHWWVPALGGVERLICEEGSFLRGVRVGPQRRPDTGTGAVMGECCWPQSTNKCYTHCYKEILTMPSPSKVLINSCRRRGFHITSVVKTNCDQLACTHEIQCCL